MSTSTTSAMKRCKFPGCHYKHKYACYLKKHQGIHISDPKVRLPNECSLCEYRARLPCQLKRHIQRLHTDQYPHHCSVPGCDYKAKIKTDVYAHVKRKHTPVQPISCTIEGCCYKTKMKAHLKRHVLNHHTKNREKTVECPFCLQKFYKAGQMQSHLRSHTKEKPWRCSLCSYESKAEAHLRRHVEAVHPDTGKSSNEALLKCDICDFTTTFKERLKNHAFSHLDFKKWPLVCNFPGCDYRAKWKNVLEAHEARAHAPERLPCPQLACSYVAKHETNLRRHVKAIHNKRFSCTFPGCKRQFHSEDACRNHQRLHDPNRPIKCEKCPQRYNRKCELYSHVLQTHSEAKDLKCPDCDYRTNQRGQLRGHLKRIHQAQDVVCREPGCNYQSCSPADMTKHSERHDAKSHPFKCEHCPYSFTHSSSLHKHKIRDHALPSMQSAATRRVSQSEEDKNLQKRSCQLCGCIFKDKMTLTRHSFTHKIAVISLTKVGVEFPF